MQYNYLFFSLREIVSKEAVKLKLILKCLIQSDFKLKTSQVTPAVLLSRKLFKLNSSLFKPCPIDFSCFFYHLKNTNFSCFFYQYKLYAQKFTGIKEALRTFPT